MNDEQKRIKALIDEQIRLLKDNPKLKGKSEEQLWAAELNSRSTKSRMSDPEFRSEWDEKQKLGAQTRSQNTEWQNNNKLAGQRRSQNTEWRENTKLAMQNKSNEWRENNALATQKACNKQISCNGVIYESRIIAALALAPETRLTHGSKSKWFENQMKNYPERYFYVDEHGNRIIETKVEVDPKTIDPTFMTLEERKALAKMKREQDDITK